MDFDTQRALRGLGDLITRNAHEQNRLAGVVHQMHQEMTTEKMTEALTKIVSATYDKAVAYTNVILVAGYASFFALWSATKPVLSEHLSIAAVLLMMLSVTIFVFFELFKMVQHGCLFSRHQDLLTDRGARDDPRLLQQRLKEFQDAQRQEGLRHVRVWIIVLWLTVPTALLAVGLLAYNFLVLLFEPSSSSLHL